MGDGLDNFGFNYPVRALVSGPYLGGNGEKEAMYPTRYTDSNGEASLGQQIRRALCHGAACRRLLVADHV